MRKRVRWQVRKTLMVSMILLLRQKNGKAIVPTIWTAKQ